MRNREFKNILMVRLTALGDVVHVLPSLRALRKKYPGAKITWVVERVAGSLLAGMKELSEVIVVDRLGWGDTFKSGGHFNQSISEIWRVLFGLRRRRFDLVIDFQGNMRSGIVSWFTGAPVRIGFSPKHSHEFHSLFYTRAVPIPENRLNKVEKDFRLLSPLGINGIDGTCEITVPEEDRLPIDAFLQGSAGRGKKCVLIHPGVSKFGAFKAWPEQSYVELCRMLGENNGIISILSWGPGERETAEEIEKKVGAGHTIIAPQTDNLKQLVHLIRRSDVFVGSDSGPLHLAAAAGIPVVGLYGPKDPVVYGPFSLRREIVRAGVYCSPCTRRRCDKPICMYEIMPKSVADACQRLLKR
ncbi:MAG: glycosyltransferase family 9 protein [Planctomycetota bacterium]|jgi:lipopolysaccharide heptosyltransferase I